MVLTKMKEIAEAYLGKVSTILQEDVEVTTFLGNVGFWLTKE